MRFLAVLLLFSITWVAIAKSNTVRSNQRSISIRKPPVQLTTAVVGEKSCAQNHLSIVLKFTFKNLGNDPVIIDTQSFVVRTSVSKSLRAAKAKLYVQEVRADLFNHSLNSPDLSDFVVVRAGEAYDLQTDQTRVSLFIDDGGERSKNDLPPGAYFLQVEVATWTYMADPKDFREKWKSHGLIWSQGLTSQPMPFFFERNRPITKCS